MTDDSWGRWHYLRCPLCGGESAGIDSISRTANPVRPKEAPAHVVDGFCNDCGCRWRLVYAWRKNETIVLVRDRDEEPPTEPLTDEPTDEDDRR